MLALPPVADDAVETDLVALEIADLVLAVFGDVDEQLAVFDIARKARAGDAEAQNGDENGDETTHDMTPVDIFN